MNRSSSDNNAVARLFLVCAAMLAVFCGGGGDGKKAETGGEPAAVVWRNNKYLGRIPAIYAWREAEKERIEGDNEAKVAKLVSGNRSNEIMDLMNEAEAALENINAKAGRGMADDRPKITGGEVAFAYSAALAASAELFYSAKAVTVTDVEADGVYHPAIVVAVSAKANVTPPADSRVYYTLVNTVDSTLAKSSFSPFSNVTGSGAAANSEHIVVDTFVIDLRPRGAGRGYTYFDGVKFVTRAEFGS